MVVVAPPRQTTLTVYATNSRDQQRRKERSYRNIITHRLGIGNKRLSFELTATFRTGPKIEDVPLILIFRPFGGNQQIAALNAGHPVVGTTRRRYRRHGDLLGFIVIFRCVSGEANGTLAVKFLSKRFALIPIKKTEIFFFAKGNCFSARLITFGSQVSSTWRTLPWLKM